MSRKYKLIPLLLEALIAGLFLSACKNTGLDKKAGISSTPTVGPIGIPSDAPFITITPDKDYKAEVGNSFKGLPSAGSMNDYASVMYQEEPQMFLIENITQDIKDRINGKSYGKDCSVPYEDLRYVRVLYWGFDEETHEGDLIVNKAIAEDIADIFKELYEHKYPIERMVLVDEYDADDNASMAANNTSAFNYRTVDDGSGRLSKHSYGLAIDINPLYNPYVRKINGETVVSPENGAEYSDRSIDCLYFIKEDDICYKAFTSRGFTWGGDWINTKDYQHFQKIAD